MSIKCDSRAPEVVALTANAPGDYRSDTLRREDDAFFLSFGHLEEHPEAILLRH